MRRYLWLLFGIGLFGYGAWHGLSAVVRTVAARVPAIGVGGIDVRGRGIAFHEVTTRGAGVEVTMRRVRLDWSRLLEPRAVADELQVSGHVQADFPRFAAHLDGARVLVSSRGHLQSHAVNLAVVVHPLARAMVIRNESGPLFIGEVAGRLIQVEAARIGPAGLAATDVYLVDPKGWLRFETVDVHQAACGWQVVARGGDAWLAAHGISEEPSGRMRASGRRTRLCPPRVEGLTVSARTPLGIRTAQLQVATLADGIVQARGRTEGVEGEVLVPFNARWAVATGQVDLSVVAALIGEQRVEGRATGSAYLWRGDTLALGLEGRIDATVHHRSIAELPVVMDGLDVALDAELGQDEGRIRVHRLARAGVEASGEGTWTASTIHLKGALAPADCQAVWRAFPTALRGQYSEARLSGRIAPGFDFRMPRGDAFKLSLDWIGPTDCTVDALATTADARPPVDVDGPTDDVDWLLRDFKLPVRYASRPVEVGPGTAAYVPIGSLPKWVGAAAIVSEDNAFNRGHALNLNLLRRALMFNLDRGRYVYGGSTIPQQLVKNLFLTRRKTLARKLQEALVAMRVVQVVPRARVLELYLNCIEFAPNVYGIERAARHYFQKGARQLTPKEAAFLATAKPSPRYAAAMRRRGATPDTPHFKEYMRRIISRMQRRGAITASQAAQSRPFRLFWRKGRISSEIDSARQDTHL